MEEYLLGKVSTDHCILFIYQNRDSVVIGRNQNPWIECRIDLLKQDNLILARRISGGGAVFHDMGNLNFTFLVSKNDYNFKKQINVILLALKELGVIAVLNDKNDLVFNNKKISGNAFSYKRNCVLHHGTLLINSNLSKLSMVLKPLANSIKTRSVKSKPSEVININEINPAITIESVKDTVTNTFKEIYGENTPIIQGNKKINMLNLNEVHEKNKSWEWLYGMTPQFNVDWNHLFDWGNIKMSFKVIKGQINDVNIQSNVLETNVINLISQGLSGSTFNSLYLSNSIKLLLNENKRNFKIFSDIANWFESKNV